MSYDASSIQSLTFKEGVRTRIQMYLGSDDIEGTYQGFKEIINNSTDEALAGYGDLIKIKVNETENSITVRDYGRGVPFQVKPDGSNLLIDIYTKSHIGGKFDDKSYRNSSGLNGVGGSCVCLSSEKFVVRSFRSGVRAEAAFVDGEPVSYSESKTSQKNGTEVYFIPSKKVFKNGEIGFTFSRICEEIKAIAFLYKGLTFEIEDVSQGVKKTYYAENGIVDFVKGEMKEPMHSHIFYTSETDGENTIEIAFQWGAKHETPHTFVNGLRCPEHGVNLTGARSSITRTFNSLSGKEFDADVIRQNLFYVMNFKIVEPSFANQTKSKINNSCARSLASKAFSNGLKLMKQQYPNEFGMVVTYLEKLQKADAAAERARKQVLEATKEIEKNQKRKVFSSDKLKDAEFLGEDSTLLLVEGLSASSSIVSARDPKKYGVLALRGKMLNLFTAAEEEIYQNEEIKLLLSAMNINPLSYDSKKLRYGRIGILVDAD